MNQPKADLFVQERRQEKLVQFTGVLRKLEQLVDWPGLAAAVNQATEREAAQPKGGRPAYPTVALLKILVLQQLHGNLSDEAMEYALLDRASWQHFVGLAQARDLPDARTLWVFKEQLAQGGGGGAMALFEVVGQQLAQAGLQARGGQLIDATLITVPKAHLDKQEKATLKAGKTPSHWSAKKTAHIDTDARWTAKREVYCFGYKAHVNTDQQPVVSG